MSGALRLAMFRTVAGVLERLPERVDLAIARRLAQSILSRGRAAENVRDNLRTVLTYAGQAPTEQALDALVRESFASYAQYWVEGAKLPALSREEIGRRFTISSGLEYLVAARASGRGVIVALPHIGSWEWGGSYLHQLGMGMLAVAEELEPPALFSWFAAKRAAIGIEVAPLNDDAGPILLQRLRDGGVVGLLCDRDIQGNGVPVKFFGHDVTMPAGPATLALRTGALVLVAACYSGPGKNHHAVVLEPLELVREGRLRDDVLRGTQLIADQLEGLIVAAPEQWHVLERRFAARD